MASRRQPFDLNSASMIGLKAELYRKRAEAKEAQKQPKSAAQRPRKPPIWARSREKVEKATADRGARIDEAAEESALLERSRQMLEAKSRLYEELTQSSLPSTDPDDESGYLVDFERKTLERSCDESERRLGASEAAEEEEEEEKEEDWVEYLDVFGRSRRCLREDLPHHLQRNDDLREDLSRKAEQEKEGEEEEEVQEREEGVLLARERLQNHNPEPERSKMKLHYADVQQNEVRSHGVGFFQFSTDEATRQAQLKELKQMRTSTEEGRGRREWIKAKRKAQLDLRLARVKERRKLAGGETAEAVVGSEESKDDEDAIAATLAELRAQAEQCREKNERINPLFPRREWDRGKAMMSAEKYLEKRRTERQGEFAPPSSYAR